MQAHSLNANVRPSAVKEQLAQRGVRLLFCGGASKEGHQERTEGSWLGKLEQRAPWF